MTRELPENKAARISPPFFLNGTYIVAKSEKIMYNCSIQIFGRISPAEKKCKINRKFAISVSLPT